MSEIKVIKFVNYKEIICEVTEETESSYGVKRPMNINSSLSTETRFTLSPWSITTYNLDKSEIIYINKSTIIAGYSATEELKTLYSNLLK